jgi:hypothetical protein
MNSGGFESILVVQATTQHQLDTAAGNVILTGGQEDGRVESCSPAVQCVRGSPRRPGRRDDRRIGISILECSCLPTG